LEAKSKHVTHKVAATQTGEEEKGAVRGYNKMVTCLCDTAKRGLVRYYSEPIQIMPHTAKLGSNGEWQPSGDSVRYAAISQIGIERWVRQHPEDRAALPDLWLAITNRLDRVDDIGDMALCLWAGMESGADNGRLFAEGLVRLWAAQRARCNAVEAAWVLTAATQAMQGDERLKSLIEKVATEALHDLRGLFNEKHSLFQRNARPGAGNMIHRRVACFADQVYPIVAMTLYGSALNDAECLGMAAAAVEQICRYQGALGQWQWHYDVPGGRVCEEYPVFSVHQDGMAPMAILASDRANGQDHRREIE